jgi:hypothetical protein
MAVSGIGIHIQGSIKSRRVITALSSMTYLRSLYLYDFEGGYHDDEQISLYLHTNNITWLTASLRPHQMTLVPLSIRQLYMAWIDLDSVSINDGAFGDMLQRLTSLRLISVNIRHPSLPLITKALSLITSCQTLRCVFGCFNSVPSSIISTLSMPQLEETSIFSDHIDGSFVDAMIKAFPRVTKLRLDWKHQHNAAEIVRACHAYKSLTNLLFVACDFTHTNSAYIDWLSLLPPLSHCLRGLFGAMPSYMAYNHVSMLTNLTQLQLYYNDDNRLSSTTGPYVHPSYPFSEASHFGLRMHSRALHQHWPSLPAIDVYGYTPSVAMPFIASLPITFRHQLYVAFIDMKPNEWLTAGLLPSQARIRNGTPHTCIDAFTKAGISNDVWVP